MEAAGVAAREYKGQLVNDLLVAQWPFISKWFEQMLKEQVEPLLQKFMPPGIKISFGEKCSLGTTPMELRRVTTATYTEESLEGEELTNIRIGGHVNWRGDSEVDVEVTGGSIAGMDLSLRAPIVIELVKLRTKPPWFSGVRIYFPDAPAIDMTVEAEVLGMNSSPGFVKRKLVKALATLICRHAVLPNRFTVGFGDGIDPFDLKHPRPQGVLRLVVLEAVGIRPYTGAPWWRFDAKREATADPYVEVSVGAATRTTKTAKRILNPRWGEEAVFDFLCDNPEKQSVCIVVRDEDYGFFSWKPSDFLGRTEMEVARLVDRQRPERGRRVPEHWMQLWGERGRMPHGRLRVRAQWRAFADEWELGHYDATPIPATFWTIGVPAEAAFYLAVDVYHATALPASGGDVPHWASLSIVGGHLPGSPAPAPLETHSANALQPSQHGLDLLRKQNAPLDVINAFEGEPRRAHALWRRRVQAGDLTPEQEIRIGGLVDAVWERSLFFLVDSLQAAKLRVAVLRPARGRTRGDGGVVLGSAECLLKEILECRRWTMDVNLPLLHGEASGFGYLKLRLQLRPLSAPAALNEGILATARDGIGKVAAGFCKPLARHSERLPTIGGMGAIDFSSGLLRRSLRLGNATDALDRGRHVHFGDLDPTPEEEQDQSTSSAGGPRWRSALGAAMRRSRAQGPSEAQRADPNSGSGEQGLRRRFSLLRWAGRGPGRGAAAVGAVRHRAVAPSTPSGSNAGTPTSETNDDGSPMAQQASASASSAARRRRFFIFKPKPGSAEPDGT